MRLLKYVLLVFVFTSCATVVNNSNFELPEQYKAPTNKKSISVTVFVKLYDEKNEFYGYGYHKEMTDLFIDTFQVSHAFTKVEALTSACSESYICLDIPSSKKLNKQRHVNIIIPHLYPKRDFHTYSKVLSVLTLGLFPAYYSMELNWEVNMYTKKREQIYTDDTVYEGKALSAVWLHLRSDKLSEESDIHYDELYKRAAKKILWNILFQLRRFP